MLNSKTLALFALVGLASFLVIVFLEQPAGAEISQAKIIRIQDNGLVTEMETTAATVGDLLQENRFNLERTDIVYPAEDHELVSGSWVIIKRAVPVTVAADGKETAVQTFSRQVRAVLSEADIMLGAADRVEPGLDEGVVFDLKITVTRVAEEEIEEEEIINFSTEYYNDSSIYKGESKVTQEGENGKIKKKFKIIYENGQEASRELISQETVNQVKNKRIAQGTKLRIGRTLSGTASWWGASGLTAASRDFAKGTTLRVTNMANGQKVTVTVNGWGPANRSRVLDLSRSAFESIADLGAGVISVRVEEIL